MITTADVRDFLKTVFSAEHYYIGKLDNKQDRSLGVYTLRGSSPPVRGIGQDTSFDIISVSLLIHWNDNARDTELAARGLFETLRTIKNVTVNGHAVYLIELLVPEPQDVGTDDKGVYTIPELLA